MAAQERKLTPESLKAMAALAGFVVDQERLEGVVHQAQQLLGRLAQLQAMGLEDVEPAFISPPLYR